MMEFAEMTVERGEDIKKTIVDYLMVNKIKTASAIRCSFKYTLTGTFRSSSTFTYLPQLSADTPSVVVYGEVRPSVPSGSS